MASAAHALLDLPPPLPIWMRLRHPAKTACIQCPCTAIMVSPLHPLSVEIPPRLMLLFCTQLLLILLLLAMLRREESNLTVSSSLLKYIIRNFLIGYVYRTSNFR